MIVPRQHHIIVDKMAAADKNLLAKKRALEKTIKEVEEEKQKLEKKIKTAAANLFVKQAKRVRHWEAWALWVNCSTVTPNGCHHYFSTQKDAEKFREKHSDSTGGGAYATELSDRQLEIYAEKGQLHTDVEM